MNTSKDERDKYLNNQKFTELCFRAMDNICSFRERKGFKQSNYYKAYRTRNIRDLTIKEINGLIHIHTFFDKKKGFHEEWRIGKRGIDFHPDNLLEADNFKNDICSKIKINKDVLFQDRKNTKSKDWWGTNFYHSSEFNSFSEKIKSGKRLKNLLYFFKYVILKNSDFPTFLKKWSNYANIYNPKDHFGQNIGFYNFYADLVEEIIFPDVVISFSDVNKLSGQDYEKYCGKILIDMGWKVQLTNKTNDQGVDIIGKFEDKVCCFQCKRYSNPVGNKAVQEIYAGKAFYNGTHAIVVSNAGFTKSAETLAYSLGVILIKDNELKNLEYRIF